MMENTSNMEPRFKSIVTELQKTVECPVCLETIKTPFKVCVRGHVACVECITKLEKCPLCQELYVLENPVCIRSILDMLPRPCVYSPGGCEEIVEPENDHEVFCGYRPIVCRYKTCSVKMLLVQLLEHCTNQHRDWYIYKTESAFFYWATDLNSPVNDYEYTLISSFKNVFLWILVINDVKEKQVKICFQATPNGKLKHEYYAQLTYGKKRFVYKYTIKATVLSSCDRKYEGEEDNIAEETALSCEQYCMRIPHDQVCRFMDGDGEIEVDFNIFTL